MIRQRTLANPVRCSGIGLHTGKKVSLALKPAEVDSGIRFVRTDLPEAPPIPALAQYVQDTRLCTTLGLGEVRIATVEHLLSALAGLGIDNAIIEVDGPEVPIMDGSSAPFVFLIQCAGIKEQTSAKKVMRILKKITVEEGKKRCCLYPSAYFRISYLLDYNHPLLRRRRVSINFSTQPYTREVARARTFGFLHEVEALQKSGFALGGSLENAVVLDQYRVINEEGLRYEDECVRHKILDTVGDLALAGHPILGAFEGECTGHEMNIRLVKAMLADKEAWRIESLDEAKTPQALAAQPAPRTG